MALRFLERELRATLTRLGRDDLAAAGSVQFTDDGGTVYVHLVRQPSGRRAARGRAFVLAWEDYSPQGSDSMYCYRWLVKEARSSLRENIHDVIRWLDGKGVSIKDVKSLQTGVLADIEAKVLRLWDTGGLRMCLAGDPTGLTRIELGEAEVAEGRSYRFKDASVRQYSGGWTSLSIAHGGPAVLLACDIEVPHDPEYVERTFKILSGIQRKKARKDGRLPPWRHPVSGIEGGTEE